MRDPFSFLKRSHGTSGSKELQDKIDDSLSVPNLSVELETEFDEEEQRKRLVQESIRIHKAQQSQHLDNDWIPPVSSLWDIASTFQTQGNESGSPFIESTDREEKQETPPLPHYKSVGENEKKRSYEKHENQESKCTLDWTPAIDEELGKLLQRHIFDFAKVAHILSRKHSQCRVTPQMCRTRWTQLDAAVSIHDTKYKKNLNCSKNTI